MVGVHGPSSMENMPEGFSKVAGNSASVKQLMALTDAEWATRSDTILNEKINKFCEQIFPEGVSLASTGFLEKHDLPAGSEVAVIGDIHGNGLRLDLTLKALQKRGYLDEEFRLLPGKSIVFLGDYMDRGKNNLKVLELVMTLKMENPERVHLLRGNHEDIDTITGNWMGYSANDQRYRKYLGSVENQGMLDRFFRALPLAVYIGQKSDSGNMEYVQFSHALFHLFTDPAPLFEGSDEHTHLQVSASRDFSDRIKRIMSDGVKDAHPDKQKKVKDSAQHVQALSKRMHVRPDDIYWLDVGKTFNPGFSGRTQIPPESIKAYLRVSGTERAKVKEIIRGHQGASFTLKGQAEGAKVVVTTIDPSSDTQKQMFMKIGLAEKVRDWKKVLDELPLLENHASALSNLVEKSVASLNAL